MLRVYNLLCNRLPEESKDLLKIFNHVTLPMLQCQLSEHVLKWSFVSGGR